jgi:hypothetical protein
MVLYRAFYISFSSQTFFNYQKNGLDGRIQKALDVVRVIGNKAVHPGQIDLRDDKATASKFFALVNLIVEATITSPKHVQGNV